VLLRLQGGVEGAGVEVGVQWKVQLRGSEVTVRMWWKHDRQQWTRLLWRQLCVVTCPRFLMHSQVFRLQLEPGELFKA
jgi:hypothetical protein